jgi:hypothetical protein
MTSQAHRCIVYATPQRDVRAFARAVARADGPWKPVAVPTVMLDAAVQALHPEAVVVASEQPRAASVLRQTRKRYGARSLVLDDRHLNVLTKLLSQGA